MKASDSPLDLRSRRPEANQRLLHEHFSTRKGMRRTSAAKDPIHAKEGIMSSISAVSASSYPIGQTSPQSAPAQAPIADPDHDGDHDKAGTVESFATGPYWTTLNLHGFLI